MPSTVDTGMGGGECSITATATLSDAIPTVATVNVTAGLSGASAARVEFGKTTDYGLTAPITDVAAGSTLLLGMEGGVTYHYRVVATVGGSECAGPDATIKTGDLPGALYNFTITGTATPGFVVTSFYQGAGEGGNAYAFIINETGQPVWSYAGVPQNTRARMSYDGQYMWMLKANVPDAGSKVVRVKMDGTGVEDFTQQFNKANHDLTVLPDERVAFFAYGSNGCDDIKIFDPATEMVTVVGNSGTITGKTMCHVNAIHYSKSDETLVFSELNNDIYAKITLTGEKVWLLGGTNSDFSGMGATWDRQHGFHLLSEDKIVFFNNGGVGMGAGASSSAVELQLDLMAKTATRTWSYTPSPGIDNAVMGDVQRLPTGNTLVTFSTKGVMQEVTTDGTKSFSMTAGNNQFGYAEWRESLYGDPPR